MEGAVAGLALLAVLVIVAIIIVAKSVALIPQAEAAVIERLGRDGVGIVAAFYVPRGAPVAEADLARHCAERLARYKCPRTFRPLDALPRSANGKLLRRNLVAQA